MNKKRIIGSIIVKDSLAVQSFGYKKYLPIGDPTIVAENLDRWGIDEILINCIDRSSKSLGPDFNLIDKIASSSITTPLIYSGGIQSPTDAQKAISSGADRVMIDAGQTIDSKLPFKISSILGKQALIMNLPLVFMNKKLFHYSYLYRRLIDLESYLNDVDLNSISEILITDKVNEGFCNSFNEKILKKFPKINKSLILFGGLSNGSQINRVITNNFVVGVAIGNFLNYKEHALQQIKQKIEKSITRPSFYQNI